VAGEIAPHGKNPGTRAIGKKLEKFQKKGNGMSLAVTLACYPSERLHNLYLGDLRDDDRIAAVGDGKRPYPCCP
jgi:hypothetical protein